MSGSLSHLLQWDHFGYPNLGDWAQRAAQAEPRGTPESAPAAVVHPQRYDDMLKVDVITKSAR
jgi:hypothetical protein